MDYAAALLTATNCQQRILFLKKCLSNDLIPRFLKFRIAENDCFEATMIHNFQRRLLRREVSEAQLTMIMRLDQLRNARQFLKEKCTDYLLLSVAWHSRRDTRAERLTIHVRHNKKLVGLAAEQEKPLRSVENTVKIIGDLKPPKYVIDLLSLGPKHPVLEQFNEMHFLANIEKVLARMKNDDSNIDAMNEVNALTLGYLKQMKRQKPDRAVKMVTSDLKKNNMKAVPFDKGAGYCLMSAGDYNERLLEVLNGEQFKPFDDSRKKDVLIAIESTFNRNLVSLVRAGKISSDLYSKCRSTGAQPARLYGLAKVHKQNTPLRPVLSLPGSCYENFTKQLSKWFDKIEEVKIETSTINIKRDLMEVSLEEDEVIVSLDVTSLYTNVPVLESIELAADILYNSEELPPIDKETFKDLMRMAVTDIYFMCDGRWYIQTDGVAMGSSLAVILANIWM